MTKSALMTWCVPVLVWIGLIAIAVLSDGCAARPVASDRSPVEDVVRDLLSRYGKTPQSLDVIDALLGFAGSSSFDKTVDFSASEHRTRLMAALARGLTGMPPNDFRAERGSFAVPIVVNTLNEGAHLVIGQWMISGELYIQLLDNNFIPRLTPASSLGQDASIYSFCLDGVASVESEAQVAHSRLLKYRRWYNFGASDIPKRYRAEVPLSSLSRETLSLRNPQVSCSCVNATIEGGTTLPPNSTTHLAIEMLPFSGHGQFQHVDLRVSRNGGGTQTARIYLFASCPDVTEIVPNAIDFGVIAWRSPAVYRMITIRESLADRFDIVDVSFKQSQSNSDASMFNGVCATVSQKEVLHDRWCHRIDMALDIVRVPVGSHEGVLMIKTTSRRTPVLSVPIHFERNAPLTLPKAISHGIMTSGVQFEKRLPVRICTTDAIELEVDDSEDSVHLALLPQDDHVALLVISGVLVGTPGLQSWPLRIMWRCGSEHGYHTILQSAVLADGQELGGAVSEFPDK